MIHQRLVFEDGSNKYMGTLIEVPNAGSEEYVAEMSEVSIDKSSGVYNIKLCWRPTIPERMKSAVNSVCQRNVLPEHLLRQLLGNNDEFLINCNLPKCYSVPGLPELNHSQVFAVKTALMKSLSLIQGPPGTGKTVTCASIVYHLNRIHGSKILVAAPNNTAVDHLCEIISLTGLKVVRFYARSLESSESPISHLALHVQAQKVTADPTLRKLQRLKAETGYLSPSDKQTYRNIIKRIEVKLLANSDVICCTCVSAGDKRLSHLKFHSVLIDEATQACEPESLIPIAVGCQQLILVGDHCQLRPITGSMAAAKAGLTRSLFERLVLVGIRPIRLQIQYRMHPALAFFSCNVFYDGSLQNGVTADDRAPKIEFPWPDPEQPMFFYCTFGQEEISANGLSFLNRSEVTAIEKIVTRLLKAGVDPKDIGIITPYSAQQAYMVYYLRCCGTLNPILYQDIEIASVEQFQGREKAYIIISCVRANHRRSLGFLTDPRRLNVSITRAQSGMIIVGDPKTLCHNPLWNELLHFYRDRHILVEGPLTNLAEYMLYFPKNRTPYKYKLTLSNLDYNGLSSHNQANKLDNGLASKDAIDLLTATLNTMAQVNASGNVAAYALAAAAMQQQPTNLMDVNSLYDKICAVGTNRHLANASAKWRLPMPPSMLMQSPSSTGLHDDIGFNGQRSMGSSSNAFRYTNGNTSLPPDSALNRAFNRYSRSTNKQPTNHLSKAGGGARSGGRTAYGTSDLLSQPGLSDITGTQQTGASLAYNSQSRGLGLSGLSQETSLDFGLIPGSSQLDNMLLSQDSTFQGTSLNLASSNVGGKAKHRNQDDHHDLFDLPNTTD